MNRKGFTLIEILVAMVLLSMVTVVGATALRLAIKAWERGEKEGDIHQAYVAVSSLMGNQLRAMKSSSDGLKLPFYGGEEGISFFTVYAPMGSAARGLIRVTYLYDSDEKTLFLYEQVITRKEDAGDAYNPLSGKFENEISPSGRVENVAVAEFLFAADKRKQVKDEFDWEKKWQGTKGKIPDMISFKLLMEDGREKNIDDELEDARTWIFATGVAGL